MKSLEIIELRSAGGNREKLERVLNSLMNEAAREAKSKIIVVYKHVTIKNGFSIHLNHDTMEVESRGSQLGLSIAANLKEYGLVNHSIWIERRRYEGRRVRKVRGKARNAKRSHERTI